MNKSINFVLLNARSLRNKTSDFVDYVTDIDADITAITETWFNNLDNAVKVECTPPGYTLLDEPRVGRRGGGTALLGKKPLRILKIIGGEKKSFEFSEWSVSCSNHKLRILIIYRPPYSEENPVPTSTFFTEFADYLESVILSPEELLITGDFNIHVDNPDNVDARHLLELLDSMALIQHVASPTHVSGHTLDLIITRNFSKLITNKPITDRFISDHCAVLCDLNTPKPPTLQENISYRKLKHIDLKSFQDDISTSDLLLKTPEQLEDLVSCYNTTLSSILDKHAPLITKKRTIRAKAPWFNNDIKRAKCERRKAERKWRSSRSDNDYVDFKVKKNHVIFLMNKARSEFYTAFINKNSDNQRKLFQATTRLLKPTTTMPLPQCDDDKILANNFGNYFISKIAKIQSSLDGYCIDQPVLPDDPTNYQFSSFDIIDEGTVQDLITKAPSKTCNLDPIPTNLLKECSVILLPILTRIVNTSLQIGCFPKSWKNAVLSPKLKKDGLEITYNNFRPVSNLSFISKLTERAASSQFHEYMVVNDLYPAYQSAYRKYHSTETTILKIMNDILLSMNDQCVTLLLLLDLSAAFDTVDHALLLQRLQTKFGVCGTALDWLNSYLAGRTGQVVINGVLSDQFLLNCGVPQGSCLGPILFVIYTSKLFDIVRHHLPNVHTYADDTQVYISFKPNTSDQKSALHALEACVADIRKWMLCDRLMVNDDKTEFLIIGTKQQLEKITINKVSVGNTIVTPSTEVRNLGVWLDSNLSMSNHISKTCSSALYYLYNIRRIRKYLSREATQTLVHALVTSRLDYCNSVLYNLPAYQIKKMQRVQNTAARLIFRVSKFCHITPVLKELHWLPVESRIQFKILVITFKVLHGLAPMYLNELVRPCNNTNYSLRSSSSYCVQVPPMKSLTTLGDRSFTIAASKLWNRLPFEVRRCKFLGEFKSKLKTHLFSNAYT